MQTLAVNYKSVFEVLPGRNILLLPDGPRFTIAAVSDGFLSKTGLTRKGVEGETAFAAISTLLPEASVSLVMKSLQRVLLLHDEDVIDIPLPEDAGVRHFRIRSIPVLSGEGDVLYITTRITRVSGASERGRNEQQRESGVTRRFHEILLQAPVPMGILTGERMVLEVANQPMLRLWGKSGSIIGKPITEGIPEISGQEFPYLLKRVYQTGEEYHGFETPAFLLKNGQMQKCYFNFVYAPIKEGGTTTGIMMVASDVTTTVESKERIEESEKRYRDLIASATVATAVYIGPEMKILLANDSMLRLWGKDQSIVGKPLIEGVPELHDQRFPRLLREVYETGKTYFAAEDRADLVIDGHLQTFYFNFTYKALRNSEGQIYGVLNMAVDVTESVKSRIKIKEAEERWRIALESAELGTWDYCPPTRKFFCSGRTQELFGIEPGSDASFEEMLAAIAEHDRQRVRDEIGKSMHDRRFQHYRVEYQVYRISDGKMRWHRTTGQAFYNEDGVAYRLTGTAYDITERKQVEEALEERVQVRTRELMEANHELERSNHELEQYAYVASHDLQEPLRKILVYTDLLKESAMRQGSPDQPRLEKIMASAMRMSHLIQDLLNFSRLLKTENAFTSVSVNEIITNITDDFELKIQETNAVIEVDALPIIEGSFHQLSQLFYNLINNALKFRKDNVTPFIQVTGRVMAKGEVTRLPELNQQLTYCDIAIRDNGIGFNVRYTTQIFEIFKRLHSRSKYEGTGIGLALCRKIARNHRGDIRAVSTEGQGSVFHVMLPLKQNPD